MWIIVVFVDSMQFNQVAHLHWTTVQTMFATVPLLMQIFHQTNIKLDNNE